MVDMFFNGMGFLGMGLFLLVYAMINLGKWKADEWRTHLPNFLGALSVIVSLIHNWNLPIFILEIFWASISLYGLYRAFRQRKASAAV
jgi:hypothetical protein